MFVCENCGKEKVDIDYSSKRFCSRSCSNTRKHSDQQKNKTSTSLKAFFIEHPRPKGEKSDVEQSAKFTKGKYNKSPKSILDFSPRTVSKILKRLKVKCCICGWNEGACDIHHIRGRKIPDADSNSNLTVLCPNHHRLAHENKVDEKDLKNILDCVGDKWLECYYG